MDPAAADVVYAYAARTRAAADQFADVQKEIAANGLPSVEESAPWEELREARVARQRPAVA
nr:hypothetical protein [Streptomyces sp. NRRL S-1022]